MQTIKLIPYIPIEGKSFGDAKISVIKADFHEVEFKEGSTVLNFYDCHFDELIIENSEEIEFKNISFHFIRCYIRHIEVEQITTNNISLNFFHTVLSGRINSENITAVQCNNCLLANSLFIDGVQSVRITFSKENLKLDVLQNQLGKIQGGKQLLESKQSYHVTKSKRVHFSSNFKLADEVLNLKLSISLAMDSNFDDQKTEINDLSLDSLLISGSSRGIISVKNVRVTDLYLSDFSTQGELRFYNIKPFPTDERKAKMSIHQCNLDNTWFDGVDFNGFTPVSFYRTKFSQTAFTSCNMPENYISFEQFKTLENIHYADKQSDTYNKDRYEMFLQLRKAFEATGNYYEAQKLQAIAHQALREIKTVPTWDRIILCVNWASNDHGLSIKRPFVWLLASSIFFYLCYLLSLGRLFNCYGWDLKLFGYYFQFLDLTHRPDFLADKADLTGWALFFDFFNKVLSGFFIYQFIAAFRKYGKT